MKDGDQVETVPCASMARREVIDAEEDVERNTNSLALVPIELPKYEEPSSPPNEIKKQTSTTLPSVPATSPQFMIQPPMLRLNDILDKIKLNDDASARWSLDDTYSQKRLAIPMIGTACTHLERFDKVSYELRNRKLALESPRRCPRCESELPLTDLRVCELTLRLLRSSGLGVEHTNCVTVDAGAGIFRVEPFDCSLLGASASGSIEGLLNQTIDADLEQGGSRGPSLKKLAGDTGADTDASGVGEQPLIASGDGAEAGSQDLLSAPQVRHEEYDNEVEDVEMELPGDEQREDREHDTVETDGGDSPLYFVDVKGSGDGPETTSSSNISEQLIVPTKMSISSLPVGPLANDFSPITKPTYKLSDLPLVDLTSCPSAVTVRLKMQSVSDSVKVKDGEEVEESYFRCFGCDEDKLKACFNPSQLNILRQNGNSKDTGSDFTWRVAVCRCCYAKLQIPRDLMRPEVSALADKVSTLVERQTTSARAEAGVALPEQNDVAFADAMPSHIKSSSQRGRRGRGEGRNRHHHHDRHDQQQNPQNPREKQQRQQDGCPDNHHERYAGEDSNFQYCPECGETKSWRAFIMGDERLLTCRKCHEKQADGATDHHEGPTSQSVMRPDIDNRPAWMVEAAAGVPEGNALLPTPPQATPVNTKAAPRRELTPLAAYGPGLKGPSEERKKRDGRGENGGNGGSSSRRRSRGGSRGKVDDYRDGNGHPTPQDIKRDILSRGSEALPRHLDKKDGDWICPGCNNNNWLWREECNRCHRFKRPKSRHKDEQKKPLLPLPVMKLPGSVNSTMGSNGYLTPLPPPNMPPPMVHSVTARRVPPPTRPPVPRPPVPRPPVPPPPASLSSSSSSPPLSMQGFVAMCLATCGDDEERRKAMRRAVEAVIAVRGKHGTDPFALLKYDWSTESIPLIDTTTSPQARRGPARSRVGQPLNYGELEARPSIPLSNDSNNAGQQRMKRTWGFFGENEGGPARKSSNKHSSRRKKDSDWECPRCFAVVYAPKTVCFKCGTPQPGVPASAVVDPYQRKQHRSDLNMSDGSAHLQSASRPYQQEEYSTSTTVQKLMQDALRPAGPLQGGNALWGPQTHAVNHSERNLRPTQRQFHQYQH